ncbi:unnamed protein product [Urochloa decumbens]|uniref:Poly(A) RNA polymerase mitochondrial-like central palm domain-containing protein n=1 Tax=Urochloa decumbens TaxID=240449 RepID=A0ABC8Z1Y4_9POAL
MVFRVHSFELLKACIEDILSTIKPGEDDQKKRSYAIQELADSIYSVGALRGATVKPFGSFVSNLYAKSGDLDVSVDLWSSSRIPISKKKKQNALRELRRALQIRGVARSVEFIPNARVPIIQYMSNQFDISCDISINNYPGQIKSRIFYWINTIDERFGDMVLLVKEWAKSQNINDPKNGTLNSYSLCLLVIFCLQNCEPAILPPLKEIYDGNVAEETVFYDEKHVDEICVANISRFLRQNMGQRNQTSLPRLFASFFSQKLTVWGSCLVYHVSSAIYTGINNWLMSDWFRTPVHDAQVKKLRAGSWDRSSTVISTYMGRFERIQDNPSWLVKPYSLFVEDPFERPDNAARAVGAEELEYIERAFNYMSGRIVGGALDDRDELVSLLCTPSVGSILGGIRANRCTNMPSSCQLYSPVAANQYDMDLFMILT